MTAFKGLGTYGNAVGVVTPLDHKLANAASVVPASATTIRPGLIWGGTATIVSGTAGMSYDVAAYKCVTQRSAGAGAVFGGNDGTLNVATTAAPGSNSRYDVVYHWHREYSLDGTDSNPVIGVVQGTAAASPAVPSLAAYPGAIELARILVPAGVTATNSGTTITQTAPFTAGPGGVVAVRNVTERNAGTWVEGQSVWLIDTDALQVYTGTRWDATGSFVAQPTAVTGGTIGSGGAITVSAASPINIDWASGDFDTVEIEIMLQLSANTEVTCRLRTGGADVSTANYNDVRVYSTTASNISQALAATSFRVAIAPGAVSGYIEGKITLTRVGAATPTGYESLMNSAVGNTAMAQSRVSGHHSLSTSYTGVSLICTSGTATGVVILRRLNKG